MIYFFPFYFLEISIKFLTRILFSTYIPFSKKDLFTKFNIFILVCNESFQFLAIKWNWNVLNSNQLNRTFLQKFKKMDSEYH